MKNFKERLRRVFVRAWIKCIIIALSILFCAFLQDAYTNQKPWQVHPRFDKYEQKKLPEYLQLRIKAMSFQPESEKVRRSHKYIKFSKIMGPSYQLLHHFGFGLIYMNRFRLYNAKLTDSEKRGILNGAVTEFDFVIKHMAKYGHNPKRLPVSYLIYVKKGEALYLLDEIAKAIRAFTNAIKLKPDFYYSYLKLSECYMKIGDNKKARQTLEIGKKNADRSRKNINMKN